MNNMQIPEVDDTLNGIEFVPALKMSEFVRANLCSPDYEANYNLCVTRALTFRRGRLAEFYKPEYDSHRSRKQGAKAQHLKFDVRLKDLRDRLIHLGPRPDSTWTVDRINNRKGYVPGNLRWSPKQTQTENRKVTKWHKVNGKQLTTAQFAKNVGLSYTTLYKRLANGWTIQRILEGCKKASPISAWNFPVALRIILESKYNLRKNFNQSRIEWYVIFLEKKLNSSVGISDQITDFLASEFDRVSAELHTLKKNEWEEEKAELYALVNAISVA